MQAVSAARVSNSKHRWDLERVVKIAGGDGHVDDRLYERMKERGKKEIVLGLR